MTSKQRRTAQNVFEDTNWAFRRKTTFSAAFPEVESVRIKVTESSYYRWRYGDGSYHYDGNSAGQFLPCHNPRCQRGGFELGDTLRYLVVDQRLEHWSTEAHCIGDEGTPHGRRKGDPCDNFFKVEVTVKYKAKSDMESQPKAPARAVPG